MCRLAATSTSTATATARTHDRAAPPERERGGTASRGAAGNGIGQGDKGHCAGQLCLTHSTATPPPPPQPNCLLPLATSNSLTLRPSSAERDTFLTYPAHCHQLAVQTVSTHTTETPQTHSPHTHTHHRHSHTHHRHSHTHTHSKC